MPATDSAEGLAGLIQPSTLFLVSSLADTRLIFSLAEGLLSSILGVLSNWMSLE